VRTAAVLLTIGMLFIATSQPRVLAQSHWLDAELVSWNAPGLSVPVAPREAVVGFDMCRRGLRTPETSEDWQVANQGWLLFAPYQLSNGISIVNGLLSMDANCRPAGFQVFVFADGIFAGTLSPMPMAARGDGTMSDVYLSRGEVIVLFDRYLPTDGLCCPSAQTRVRFIIEWTTAGPVVTPVTAEHWSAPSPGR
jgi:hypothetical protein